jgi:hypothetical protein
MRETGAVSNPPQCRGRPRIEQDADGTVWVGGPAITCIQGEVDL